METRYPFLDKSVVQEFLNLIPNLKNKYPKSPIYNFLRTYHITHFVMLKNSASTLRWKANIIHKNQISCLRPV